MNKSNIILIIQAVCMYLIHIPFYLILILAKIPSISFETVKVLFTIGFSFMSIMAPVCIISFIFAGFNMIRSGNSPLKTAIIVKIVLIPWYIFNLLVCILLLAGFLNPWLMMAIPLLICIEVVITYIFMLSTSAHSVFYTIKYLSCKKIKPNKIMTVALIFHFIFCLDIVGAVMLNMETAKQNGLNSDF